MQTNEEEDGMRSSWTILVAAAALALPQLAAADEVEEQLRQMNERMSQMEQQLDATNEELAASKQRVEQQEQLINRLDEDRDATSALSKFLSETEFSGAVAASYTYNFNNNTKRNLTNSAIANDGTTGGVNEGLLGLTAPHHSNSNNFQVDQFYLRMKKTPMPESRGGWGATLVYGTSADAQAGREDEGASSDLTHLYEAYAEYMFNVGSGVTFGMGRFETVIGYESFLVDQNAQVTRGLLWALQPVNHTGAYLKGDCECGINWLLGASNNYTNAAFETDKSPTFVGRVGWSGETLGMSVGGLYGGDIDAVLDSFYDSTGGQFRSGVERTGDAIGLIDAVLTWDPSENLSAWVNFDYYWTGNSDATAASGASSLTIYGFAGGARYAFTEAAGFSLRYEYLHLNDIGVTELGGFPGMDIALNEITGTIDYALSDNLTLKAEGRYDWGWIQEASNNLFANRDGDFSSGGKKDQLLGIIQLMYTF
jgi:hypothetical protein